MKAFNQIEYVEKTYEKNIHTLITNQVDTAIRICEKYNLNINPIYNDFKPINHRQFIKKYFKRFNNVNLKNIQLNIDSNFSITLPQATEQIAKRIKKWEPKIKKIIDGTSNIGSTAIILSQFFNQIYAVEINNTTYQKLKHNVSIYNLSNVKTYNENIMKFMNKEKKKLNTSDTCLFLDPQWTGVFYSLETTIDLYFGSINVLDFIKSQSLKYIVMKVPHNYNFSDLYKSFYDIEIIRSKGFYIVMLRK